MMNNLLTQDGAHMLSNMEDKKLISVSPSVFLFIAPFYGDILRDVHTLRCLGPLEEPLALTRERINWCGRQTTSPCAATNTDTEVGDINPR